MAKYLYKDKKIILLYCFISILTYISLTFLFKSYSWITNVTENKNLSVAYKVTFLCALLLFIILIMLIILSIIKRYLLNLIISKLRKDVFGKIYQISTSSFLLKNTAFYTSLLINDLDTIEDDYLGNYIELIGDVIQLIIMLFAIGFAGLEFLLIVVLFSIPSLFHPMFLRKKLGEKGLNVSKETHTYMQKVNEFIYSFEIIKIFKKVPIINSLFMTNVNNLGKAKRNEDIIKAISSCFMALTIYFVKFGSQIYFTRSAILGTITVGSVALLYGLTNNVGNPINSILDYITTMNSTKDVRKKIINFLSQEEEKSSGTNVEDFVDCINFHDVTFSYDQKHLVLNNLNISFEKGKKYALIGESGCGKSTVLKLIMKYYSNFEGSITYDSNNIEYLSTKKYKEKIAYINQNSYLFSGTLKENVTLYNEKYTKDEIINVIQLSGLEDLLTRLPQGLETQITEGGKNLSGGEKQRISIARALITGADIILIDEGAAALDNITATNVEKTLLGIEGKTIISVIHRINETIELYDDIYILDNGKISEHGRYDELIDKNSKFSSILNLGGEL